MPQNLDRLKAAGFQHAGRWVLVKQELQLELDPVIGNKCDVLYAFAVDGALRYIGKTATNLRSRLQGYKSPPNGPVNGASTNIKNNRNIVQALESGSAVEIFALYEISKRSHSGFAISLAAGLEDSLIGDLSPLWNGRALAAIKATSDLTHRAQTIPYAADTKGKDKSIVEGVSKYQSDSTLKGFYPSAEQLLAFARKVEGTLLETLERRAPFSVAVVGKNLEITPKKTSTTPRLESFTRLEAVLAQLRETDSFQMSHYQQASFNASYILALVKRWQFMHQ